MTPRSSSMTTPLQADMPLPEFVGPALATGGPLALLLVLLRFGPDAFLRLLAGTAAVLTRDDTRGQRCLDVLRILHSRDGSRCLRHKGL